jgi:hypothetical protein
MSPTGKISIRTAFLVISLLVLAVQAQIPSAPVLSSPASGGASGTTVTVSWHSVTGATSYTLQISQTSAFSSFLVNQNGLAVVSQPVSGLSINTMYYWRVSASSTSGQSAWSSIWSFSVISLTTTPVSKVF